MDITVDEFARDSMELAPDQEWAKGVVIDFGPVRPNDSTYGYYMYAQLGKSADYLVKTYVRPEVDDATILEWVLEQKEMDFHIVSRQWRLHENGQRGSGYAILNADMYKFDVKEEENV